MASTMRLAAARDDPVLHAIENLRAAEARLNKADETQAELMALCAPEVRSNLRDWSAGARATCEAPEQLVAAELDRELREALQHYRSAWQDLLETRPTSLLGLSAKVLYLTEHEESEVSRALHDDVIALLRDLPA